jgi:hypothetical protein
MDTQTEGKKFVCPGCSKEISGLTEENLKVNIEKHKAEYHS